MKRALELSLAISLALGAGHALAVGLGQIQVKSRLNQPLVAEIPVTVDRGSDAESLVVALASAEEFSRIGMERSQIGVPLEFVLVKGVNGQAVIRVTSIEPVRAPFLDFLIAANWSTGRVLREYTVLLDPPTTAPAVAAVAEPVQVERQPAVQLPPPEPVRVEPVAEAPAPVAADEYEAPEPVQAPVPLPEPVAAPIAVAPARSVPKANVEPAPQVVSPAPSPTVEPPPSVATSNSTSYGPVSAGETLGQIARANLPDDGVSTNQLMLALLNANPQAFSDNNINRLKRGAILRIPSPEEIRAVGSTREAAAQVRAQAEVWRGEQTAPTLLAGSAADNVGQADFSTATSGPVGDDRLALVPPEMGKDGLASTGQAGSTAGTARGNATAAELARSNEELKSREQEASELRSRLTDLEKIQTSNERLISLKDSEIADLQRKLAMTQADAAEKAAALSAANAVAQTAPSVAPVDGTPAEAAPVETVATPQEDIWSKDGNQVSPPSHTTAPDTTAPDTTAPDATTPDATTPDATTPDATTPDAIAAADATTEVDATATAEANTLDSPAVEVTPEGLTDPAGIVSTDSQATSPDTAAVETPPLADSQATTVADTALPIENPGSVDQPVVAPTEPAVEETPWYLDARVLGGAGLIALLLGFFAWRSRRETPPVAAKPSIADKFGPSSDISPVGVGQTNGAVAMDEERQLAEQIAEDPTDLGARLELISIYYADNRVDEFRAAALAMEPFVDNPREPEWIQVRAMGDDLLPNDPLFSGDLVSQADVAHKDWSAEGISPVDDRVRWSDDLEGADEVDGDRSGLVDSGDFVFVDRDVEAPIVTGIENELPYVPGPVIDIEPVSELDLANDDLAVVVDPSSAIDDAMDELDADAMDAKAGGGLIFTLEDAPELSGVVLPSTHSTSSPELPSVSGRPLTEVSMDRPPSENFDFELPPLEFESSFGESSSTEAAAQRNEDLFDAELPDDLADHDHDDEFLTDEDALGTKIDLARAYVDMGDPDGARGMLEEVLAAGDVAQQEEARRLLAELG